MLLARWLQKLVQVSEQGGKGMRLHSSFVAIVLATVLLAACATSRFTSTWRNPEAQPLQAAGSKVAALVMAKNEATRRAAEDALAKAITARGAQGVPMYSIAGTGADEAKTKAALEKEGFVAVVVMRPVGSKQEISSTTYAGPSYGGFYGGYYGYGWGAPYRRQRDSNRHDRERRDAGVLAQAKQAGLGRTERNDESKPGGQLRPRAGQCDGGGDAKAGSHRAFLSERRDSGSWSLDRPHQRHRGDGVGRFKAGDRFIRVTDDIRHFQGEGRGDGGGQCDRLIEVPVVERIESLNVAKIFGEPAGLGELPRIGHAGRSNRIVL